MENEIINTIRIGITGHRNLTAEQTSALEPAIKRVIENIIYYNQIINNCPPDVVFTSPLATGTDTLFANIVIKYFLGRIRVFLPFEKEEYLKDFETAEQKEEFERLLADSKVTEVLTLGKLSAGQRDDLYLAAGKKVIDDNDYIIAVWDEEKAKGTGGTGDIVDYAISLRKNLLVINPNDRQLIIKGNYLSEMKFPAPEQPFPKDISNNIVADYFDVYDGFAVENQKLYKRIWRLCFRIGWLGAALILSVKVAHNFQESIQFVLTVFEITCLSIIVVLIVREKKQKFHQNYLLYRFIAERLRINNLIYSCGYYPIKTETKVIHQALQEIEARYPVDIINKIIRLTSYSCTSLDKKKEIVRSFAAGQSNYHNKRKVILEKENEMNSRIKTACIVLFAAVILYHTVYELSGTLSDFNIKDLFKRPTEMSSLLFELSILLYLFIPATLARFEAVKYINDWERLITQSGYMSKFFAEIAEKSKTVQNDNELCNLLIQLNDNMYLENLDWEMFMINKDETIT